MENPWQVDSMEAFACLQCPECDFACKEENIFQDHALGNHPLSYILFGRIKRKNDTNKENERYDQNDIKNFHNVNPQKEFTGDTTFFITTANDDVDILDSLNSIENEGNIVATNYFEDLSNKDKENESMWKCQICDTDFRIRNDFQKHYIECMKEQEKQIKLEQKQLKCKQKQIKCKLCSSLFTSKKNLGTHLETIHNEITYTYKPKLKLVKCKTCHGEFEGVRELKRHVMEIHEGIKFFKCPFCSSKIMTKSALNLHIKSVHEEKKYQCVVCTDKFAQKHYWKYHIEFTCKGKRRNEGKKLQCPFCEDRFSPTGLEYHLKHSCKVKKGLII